jgi:hypothetical protein
MSDSYRVSVNEYCDRNYIKDFVKKYSQKRWSVAEEAIRRRVKRPEKTEREDGDFELICAKDNRKIYKGGFKIPKTDTSVKNSGNRFITYVNTKSKQSHVLLIYKKQDHVKGNHETAWWRGIIGDVYPELEDLV